MADAFEDEVEETITIGEFIEGMEQRELDADLVLGGDEGKECTYAHGYMKRQAVFSCLTCVPEGNAGFCTACSLSCHDGHEVVELWTKRKFRCDCGNSKFGEFYCKLCANKDPENTENTYSQNFKGSYCTCGGLYPDPLAEEQAEMIQCCVCEDWFHENHIGLDISEELPINEEGDPLYDEFICQDCALKCSFVRLYPAAILATSKESNTPVKNHADGNVLENDGSGSHDSASLMKCSDASGSHDSASLMKRSDAESKSLSTEKDSVHGGNTTKELDSKNAKANCENLASSPECILGVDLNATSLSLEEKKSMFLSKNWRNLLCRCVSCSEFYKKIGVDFLIDKEDSIEEYEKVAKRKREEKLQQGEEAELNFLNGLGHVQKIEILSGINDMKNEFVSFLESFDTSKSVSAEDVQGIFENLKKKKQRLL